MKKIKEPAKKHTKAHTNKAFIKAQLHDALEITTKPLYLLQSVVDTIREPFLILDNTLHVLQANHSFYQTFHVSRKNTEKKLVYELGGNQWDIPQLRKLLEKILPKNSHFDNFEVEYNFPHIGRKIMLLNARRVFADGERILLAIEDVTKQRDLEKQKDEFSAVIAHELKGPVAAISSFSQLIEAHFKKVADKDCLRYTDIINEQVHRLTNLINGLLNAGRIRAVGFEYSKKIVDIDELIENTIAEVRQASLTHEIVKHGKTPVNLLIDPERIGQVLINLITNAIKYSPKAGKVIVHVASNKSEVTIGIQDFGIGIEKKDQKNIFARFSQVHGAARGAYYSVGLGLDISARIIQHHNGRIWLKSAEGKGSTFYFALPIVKK